MTKRKQIIEDVLHDLISLRAGISPANEYALEENIAFFRALRSPRAYLRWATWRAPEIDGDRLLELSDFQLPRWQTILQEELVALEKRHFKNILGPLADEIAASIRRCARAPGEPIIILDVGSGGMEVERHVVHAFREQEELQRNVVFLGVDASDRSIEAGLENVREEIPATFIGPLGPDTLSLARAQGAKVPFSVVACRGDAAMFGKYFPPGSIDIAFYSKLKHHIPHAARAGFVSAVTAAAARVIEWDDYRGAYLFILSALSSWKNPVLMNGAVFSALRDPSKDTLRRGDPGWRTTIFPLKGYLKIHDRFTTEEKLLRTALPDAGSAQPAVLHREKIGNHTINYLVAGGGPPVVLLHGINIGWGQWYPNIAELAKHFTVYAIDLPGAGRSSDAGGDLIRDYVAPVEEFIKKKNIEGAHLIGHSLGGWVALSVARRGKAKVGKLLLVSPLGLTRKVPAKFIPVTMRPVAKALAATAFRMSPQNLKKILAGLVGRLELHEDFLEYYHEAVVRRGSEGHPFIFINGLCTPFRMRRELALGALADIGHETLVVGGEYDFLVNPVIIRRQAASMPRATVRIFRDSGHVAAIEESGRFNKLAAEFLLRTT